MTAKEQENPTEIIFAILEESSRILQWNHDNRSGVFTKMVRDDRVKKLKR